MSNNAVAIVDDGERFRLYSFAGLLKGKTWRDVTNRAFEYDSDSQKWREMASLPGPGRLASTAQTVNGQVYVFGGYTVAEDGSEVSWPAVYRYDPQERQYHVAAPMPIPVDDAVSAVYRNRYIYLVSGWHDTDNVDRVQVFDTQTNGWSQATRFPGPPVFGHNGGLLGQHLLICDGVKVIPATETDGQRQFVPSDVCFLGEIDRVDPTRIVWRETTNLPGPALYRAAASASTAVHPPQILMAGGAHNPYNYNGIGYNQEPSAPTPEVWGFEPLTRRWIAHPPLARPSMDHRGLLDLGTGEFLIIGGMLSDQRVTGRTTRLKIN